MTCQDCTRLQQDNARLEHENTELRCRLTLYENPRTPPSRRIYPSRRTRGGPRFPGRPRGYRGTTKPTPSPNVVVEPPRKDRCESCGAYLGEPGTVSHRIVEEISNPAPKQVTGLSRV